MPLRVGMDADSPHPTNFWPEGGVGRLGGGSPKGQLGGGVGGAMGRGQEGRFGG